MRKKRTNFVESGERIWFNGDDKTSFEDICGHGQVNVEEFSNVFKLDGGESARDGRWCSGEQRIDEGGDERRT